MTDSDLLALAKECATPGETGGTTAAKASGTVDWLTPTTVANKFLGIHINTLYAWIKNRFGPPVYSFYGQWRYRRGDVEEWVEQRRQTMEDPLLAVVTVVEASRMIGVNKNTLWVWIQNGKGPPNFIFNGRYVFKRKDVEKWIEENKTNAA
jgi:predicted site-specific integrase-resolvase